MGRSVAIGLLLVSFLGLGTLACKTRSSNANLTDHQHGAKGVQLGLEWIAKVKTKLASISNQTSAMDDAAMDLVGEDAGSPGARIAEVAIIKQILNVRDITVQLVVELALVLDEGHVLYTSKGTTFVPEQDTPLPNGGSIVGVRTVSKNVGLLQIDLTDSFSAVLPLNQTDRRARMQALKDFTKVVENIGLKVKALELAVNSWPTNPSGPSGPGPSGPGGDGSDGSLVDGCLNPLPSDVCDKAVSPSLVWRKESSSEYFYSEAWQHCEKLNVDGNPMAGRWRIPTLAEIKNSIPRLGVDGIKLIEEKSQDDTGGKIWSSTSHPDRQYQKVVYFPNGSSNTYDMSPDSSSDRRYIHALCVKYGVRPRLLTKDQCQMTYEREPKGRICYHHRFGNQVEKEFCWPGNDGQSQDKCTEARTRDPLP